MDDPLPDGLESHWKDLLASKPSLTSTGICEAVFSHPVLFPLQRRRELEWMLLLSSKKSPRVVMEIGADKGGGIFHWCSLPTVQQVIACEIRGVPYVDAFGDYFSATDIVGISESSYSVATVNRVQRMLLSPIDVLFIDGDKGQFDTDFLCYLPLMAKDGIVFFHDIQDEAPRAGFNKVKGDYFAEEFIDKSESAEAVTKEKANIPSNNAHENWLRYWKGRSCGVGVIHLITRRGL